MRGQHVRVSFATFITALLLAGCLGPLDILGVISEVTNGSSGASEPEDDLIGDKHPQYDPALTVTEEYGGCRIELNKSGSVTKLDLNAFGDEDEKYADLIFRGRAEAMADLAGHETAELIPSMEVVNGAMKPFNDGLYAAVEIGAEDGIAGIYAGKKVLLQDLLDALLNLLPSANEAEAAHIRAAAADVGAALILAGESPALPAEVRALADAAVSRFSTDELSSRPIGFYTWSDALERIFRQDRFLQNGAVRTGDPYAASEFGKFGAMALVLGGDPDLLERYESVLAIYAGLTNPYANYSATALIPYVLDLTALGDPEQVKAAFLIDNPASGAPYPWCNSHFALFPSSASKEGDYFQELECSDALPADANLMDVLIDAIRSGALDLAPSGDSGWYDYQTYALETLLLPERGPESDHLLLTAAYKKKLMDTFRSIMTQNRETHVKQSEVSMSATSAPPQEVDIYPKFPVEPFPTFYLRSARAYRFLEVYLSGILGTDFLQAVSRLNEDGTVSAVDLQAELHAKASLLYGLAIITSDSLGMRPQLLDEEMAEYNEEQCREAALAWIAAWKEDADVLKDARVIVPVNVDNEANVISYWAVIGIKVIKVKAEFVEGFEPEVVDDGECEVRDILPHTYYMLVEEFAEVERSGSLPPLTRDEFRAICDAGDNRDDIVSALQGG